MKQQNETMSRDRGSNMLSHENVENFFYVYMSLTSLERRVFQLIDKAAEKLGPLTARGVRNMLIEFLVVRAGEPLLGSSIETGVNLSREDKARLMGEYSRLGSITITLTEKTKRMETLLRRFGVQVPSYETVVRAIDELINMGFITERGSVDKKIKGYYMVSPLFYSFRNKARSHITEQIKFGVVDGSVKEEIKRFYGIK